MDNNKSNQLNPNHSAFWKSRGHSERPINWFELLCDLLSLIVPLGQAALNNRSNQLNPNSPVFASSRGLSNPKN